MAKAPVRRKKTDPKPVDEIADIDNAIPDPPIDVDLYPDIPEPGTVPSKTIETHTTKTVFASRKKLDDDAGTQLFYDEETRDPLAQMLLSFNDNSDIKLKVKRLPDPPNLRGRFMTPCNDEMQCGTITVVNPADYETEVRDAFGGGRYQLTVLSKGKYQASAIKILADPPRPMQAPGMFPPGMFPGMPGPMPNQQPGMMPFQFFPYGYQQQQLPAKSGLAELTERMTEVKALKEIFGPIEKPAAPAPGTMSITEFLMSDKDTRSKIAGSIIGQFTGGNGNAGSSTTDNMPWYGKVLMMAVENPMVLQVAGPLLFQTIATLINKFGFTKPQGGQTPAPNPQNSASAHVAPAINPVQSAPNAQPTMEIGNVHAQPTQPLPVQDNGVNTMNQPTDEQPDPTEAYYKILDGCMDYLERNIPFPDLQWFDVLEKQFPQQVEQFKAIITLPLPVVKGIISTYGTDYATALQLEHADAWLTTLFYQINEREKANVKNNSQ
jgi:hypothetical protein